MSVLNSEAANSRRLRFQVFGGPRVWLDEVEVGVGSARHRIVLAELLVAGDQVVSINSLVDALWGDAPPATAVNQLHQIVGQLRRTLEPELPPRAAGRWVMSSGTGYRLAASAAVIDLGRIRDLARQSRDLVSQSEGDAVARSATAVALLCEALELAQRPALGALPARVLERPEFVAVQAERVALALQAGHLAADHDDDLVVARVLRLVQPIAAEVPLHEGLQAHVVRLLAAAGRRADALTLADQLRRRLADELGIDPGHELQAAHREVLSMDRPRPVAEDSLVDVATTGSSAAVRPAQLPAATPHFTGRDDVLRALDYALDDSAGGGTVLVSALGGMAGAGKTALAVHWAHDLVDRFPDGQLFVNLRGFDPTGLVVDPFDALGALLDALGVSRAPHAGEDLPARSARFRTVMSGRRFLLLLDNARDSDQVRPLLPGAAGCLVIVTSRNRLTSLVAREGARPVLLGRLTSAQSLRLLTDRLGEARVKAQRDAVETMLAVCDGLPLALSIVAARAAMNPSTSLAELASELTSTRPLDVLTTGEISDDLRATFTWSYETLSPNAARLFRLFGAHPAEVASLASLASMLGVGTADARNAAAQLLAANMIEELSVGRFTMHDLLRAYARELLDASAERADVERRLVEHYAASARAASLVHGRPPVAELDRLSLGIEAEQPRDIVEAHEWFRRERRMVSESIGLALVRGMNRTAALLFLDSRVTLWKLEGAAELLPIAIAALDGARRAQDLLLQAELDRAVAYHLYEVGEVQRGLTHFERALSLFQVLGDLGGEALTLRNLANVYTSFVEDDATSERYARRAVDVARRAAEPYPLCLALSAVGCTLMDSNDVEALEYLQEGLDIAMEFDLADLQPFFFSVIARCLVNLNDFEAALRVAESGLSALGVSPSIIDETLLASLLAKAALQSGDRSRALEACRRFRRVVGVADERAHVIETVGSELFAEYEADIDQVMSALAVGTRRESPE